MPPELNSFFLAGFESALFVAIFCALIIWSSIWKGLALWRAARINKPGWFVALLIFNTLGIFEIIFLIATREKKAQ